MPKSLEELQERYPDEEAWRRTLEYDLPMDEPLSIVAIDEDQSKAGGSAIEDKPEADAKSDGDERD